MNTEATEGTNRPVVSIIVTVYNDSANLARSVASAAAQSVRDIEILIVDDCSVDDSFDVAREYASVDARISVHKTPQRSGPGGPRNVGLDAARAPWVLFLDGDDELDEHAVRELLKAAEEDAADIACGQTERHFRETGEVLAWHDALFASRRRLTSISQCLDLVMETSIGKLYRRAFLEENGFRFRESVAYEDLIFSAQVYGAASSISLVPARVYIWSVYPSDVRRSISNSRQEAINLQHRIEAFKEVLRIAADSGKDGLLERYQLKFVEHDARLYLKDLVFMEDEDAERVLTTLDPELRGIPEHVYMHLDVQDRLMHGVALCGSVAGVREAKPAVKGYVLLEGRTLEAGGRVVWRPTAPLGHEPQLGSLEDHLLDITGDEILDTPFGRIGYGHRVSAIELETEGRAIVKGVTTDPLGRIRLAPTGCGARAVASLQGGNVRLTWPVRMQAVSDQRWEWEFRLEIPRRLPYVRPMRFELDIELDCNGEINVSPVWLRKGASVPRLVPPKGTLRSFLREWFAFSRIGAGRLTVKLSEPHGRRGRLDVLVHRVARGVSASGKR